MKIGLALSGGGFRATLFHLGVIRFLSDANLLRDVVYVSSVSGGSVLGAHLVLNWSKYTDPAQFDSISQELLSFVQRDVRGRIVRRYLLSAGLRSLTSLFTQECNRLANGERLEALRPDGRPFLEMLATSLSNGLTCVFSHRGLFVDQYPDINAKTVAADGVPIGLAIAASAAFPPLFPAVELSHRTLRVSEAEMPRPHFATDGGVYDNLGIQMLQWSDGGEGLNLEMVILSDAGAPFDLTHEAQYTAIIGRNMRATEVMMYRNSVLTLQMLGRDDYAHKIVQCQIGRFSDLDFGETPAGKWHGDLRRLVARVRTDLDRFTASEINLLVRHGYLVARKAVGARHPLHHLSDSEPWMPLPDAPLRSADVGTERVWLRFPMDDSATWGIFAVLLLIGLTIAYLYLM